MSSICAAYLNATVGQSTSKSSSNTSVLEQWQIKPVKRRQNLVWSGQLQPAGVLIAIEGEVLLQRHGLSGTLLAGQTLLLEECAGHTQFSCDAQSQACWIGFPRAALHGQALYSQLLEHPLAVPELLDTLSHNPESSELSKLLERLFLQIRNRQLELLELLPRCPGRSRQHRIDVLSRLQRVKTLLDIPQGPVVDLETLARAAHYSLSHFQRMFTRVYQLSPIEQQRQNRLARARQLITVQRWSVRRIAESVGFESRSTFNRLFRERFGNSAGRVREGMR